MNIYKQALEDSYLKVQNHIKEDLSSEDFDWDRLIDLIIEEDSPLQDVFGAKTIQLAELFFQAKKLATVADDIENENLEIPAEKEALEELEEETLSEKTEDDFADFEDLE